MISWLAKGSTKTSTSIQPPSSPLQISPLHRIVSPIHLHEAILASPTWRVIPKELYTDFRRPAVHYLYKPPRSTPGMNPQRSPCLRSGPRSFASLVPYLSDMSGGSTTMQPGEQANTSRQRYYSQRSNSELVLFFLRIRYYVSQHSGLPRLSPCQGNPRNHRLLYYLTRTAQSLVS